MQVRKKKKETPPLPPPPHPKLAKTKASISSAKQQPQASVTTMDPAALYDLEKGVNEENKKILSKLTAQNASAQAAEEGKTSNNLVLDYTFDHSGKILLLNPPTTLQAIQG
jgi:hypothetical protein